MDVRPSPLRSLIMNVFRSAPQAPSTAITSMVRHLAPDDVLDALIPQPDNLVASPSNPQRFTEFIYIGPNDSKIHVTHEQAIMQAAVWACIDVISAALAGSNWNVYSGVRESPKNRTLLFSDPLQWMLNTRPNPEMSAMAAKRAMLISAVGWGNGYAEIQWDASGRVAGLWPISPDRVTPLRRLEDGVFVYRVLQDYAGGFVDVDPVDIFHVRGAGITGLRGDDMIAKAIQTIARGVALDRFAASYFANGAHVGGVITAKGKLDDPAYTRMQEQVNKSHAGSKNAFKTMVLDGGATYLPIDSNAQKAELINSKYILIEEVCRWFRVPPHKIAHLLRATNNNIEQQGLEFSRDSLRPWRIEIEQEAAYKLFSPRGPAKYVEIDVDWTEQGDYESRSNAYTKLITGGVFSVNDVLRKLGENTIGTEGDVHIVQGAMMPLERVGESFRETGTPTVPEAPAGPATEKPSGAPDAKPSTGGGTNQADGVAAARAETLQTWLASILARNLRRHEARLADGRDKAAVWSDSLAHLSEALADISPALCALGTSGAREIATGFGVGALRGVETTDEAARRCIEQLTRTAT